MVLSENQLDSLSNSKINLLAKLSVYKIYFDNNSKNTAEQNIILLKSICLSGAKINKNGIFMKIFAKIPCCFL